MWSRFISQRLVPHYCFTCIPEECCADSPILTLPKQKYKKYNRSSSLPALSPNAKSVLVKRCVTNVQNATCKTVNPLAAFFRRYTCLPAYIRQELLLPLHFHTSSKFGLGRRWGQEEGMLKRPSSSLLWKPRLGVLTEVHR